MNLENDLQVDDLVYINHSQFNRMETFRIVKISKQKVKLKDIHTNVVMSVSNKSLLKKVNNINL